MAGNGEAGGAAEREATARRVKAAQALGGFSNVETLAQATKDHGNIGLKRLREIQQRRGDMPRAIELRTIADVCGLPYEFFTVDFEHLGEPRNAQNERRFARLEAVVRLLAESVSLDGLDEDEARLLRDWRLRNESPTEGEESGSKSQGEA